MNFIGKLAENVHAHSARQRGRLFLEAAMAAAALVATADGRMTLAKRATLDQVVASIDALRNFGVQPAVASFDFYASALRERPAVGRDQALRAVGKMAEDAQAAELIIKIVRAMGHAGDGFSVRELSRITEVSAALGLAPPALGNEPIETAAHRDTQPHVVTLGNQKGGTGKSTAAMHLTVALLLQGLKVGALDLDGRQATLSGYLRNRAAFAAGRGQDIPMPVHRQVEPSSARDRNQADSEERARVRDAFADMADCDVVIIDTPGSESHLSRIGHINADILITPLNDSFLDVDILARVNRAKRRVLAPSTYCKMVWDLREERRASGRKPVDWIVMRNRLAHLDTRSNRDISNLLILLSQRIGFRLQPGFSERVVFRELFEGGRTVLDPPVGPRERWNTSSHRRAQQEIHDLVQAIGVMETARPAQLKTKALAR